MKQYISYIRVSTKRQGDSGLGLEAQERDISLYLDNYAEEPFEVIASFCDVASGTKVNRPQLAEAIELSAKTGATILVAKLDRISRDVEQIAGLIKRCDFIVASMPHADKFSLHIYSALAEQERDFISIRTKSALQAYKVRNPHKKLGSPSYQVEKLNEGKKKKALEEAQKVSGLIVPLRKQGASLRNICNTLNTSGITTCRGTEFHPSLVSRMLNCLECA